jgi:proline iminopeptidase
MLGEGRPVVFILPGGPGADHSVYMKYACLSDVADLVFHDPRGCGQSDKGESSTYTMNNYIDDVEAIRQHFSLEKIMVLGKSYGAMCALGYALRYPAAVTKLILSAGAPSARFLETAKKNVRRLGTPEQIEVCQKLWSGSFRSREEVLNYFQLMNPLYSVKARNCESKTDLIKKSQQFSYEVLNEGFKRSFWHFDYENELQKVLCPTLILAGREDWIADMQYSEFMVARIPHSELRVFEHASHAMEADAPEEYFQAIADFIQY